LKTVPAVPAVRKTSFAPAAAAAGGVPVRFIDIYLKKNPEIAEFLREEREWYEELFQEFAAWWKSQHPGEPFAEERHRKEFFAAIELRWQAPELLREIPDDQVAEIEASLDRRRAEHGPPPQPPKLHHPFRKQGGVQ
jgi:hypothetical protein